MTTKTETQTQKPTANGVIKGRPGKGRVLSLGQRKRCYAGHTMTPDNTFRYTAKPVKGQPKPVEREWCKRCRAISRKASATARRLREAKEFQARQKEGKAQLAQALPKAATPKAAKAVKASGGVKQIMVESADRVEKIADKALQKARKAAKAAKAVKSAKAKAAA